MNHHLAIRTKIIIMLSIMASLFLVALDQTIVATSLGRIVEEFQSYSMLSWVITSYMLTTTITVPIAGKLSDLFGRRIMTVIGVAVFVVGSLASGLSGDMVQLIAARALQGIGAGIITANAFTIIGDLFAARERAKWQGIFGAVFGLSSLIGPLLGGWLTEGHAIFSFVTDWRWTFFINVPIGIIAFILILTYCPPLKHTKKPKVDYLGAGLLSLALGTLILAVANTDTIFKDFLVYSGMAVWQLQSIMYVIVAMATAAFIYVENRSEQPILPLNLFKNRNIALIVSIATLFGAGFMGSIIYLTQFNQQVFGASPTESGLMLLPMIAGIMISSISSGQLISRIGKYKIFMQVGFIVATVMMMFLTLLSPDSQFWQEAIMIFLLGLGLGVGMPVINLAIQNEVEQSELGVATSSNQLFRGLGSTIGIAVFGSILTAGIVGNLVSVDQSPYLQQLSKSPEISQIGNLDDPDTLLTLNSPDVKKKITDGFDKALVEMPAAQAVAAKASFDKNQEEFSSNVKDSFSNSLRNIFISASLLLAVSTVLVFMLEEKELKKADSSATPGV